MTISLKIEIVKIFKLEFELSSEKKPKKEEQSAEKKPDPKQPAPTK